MALLSDFPPSPLDFYRKKASFDWKKLKIYFETEDVITFKNELYKILSEEIEFDSDIFTLTIDEDREKTLRQYLFVKNLRESLLKQLQSDYRFQTAFIQTIEPLVPSVAVLLGARTLFTVTIETNGTERHRKILNDETEGKIRGCFALTEIGHGSNTKGMQTTATYDKETKEFIINSPSFEAAKCWSGGLGQHATHIVFFAQLYIDDVCYGLHPFVCPIRNPKNLLPYSGLIIGDMGEKIGLNGIDNGFIIFNDYRIPRESLLNKNADVLPDGRYIQNIEDKKKTANASFAALSFVRIGISCNSSSHTIKALTIAIRYAAVRKQFGPNEGEEIPILEYQSHQYRLLPHLAGVYVVQYAAFCMLEKYNKFLNNPNDNLATAFGIEMHIVSSATKPLVTWMGREAIQECREACAGHGYLKVAGFGNIRSEQEASITYEGENHVLIQQTSNWLVRLWPLVKAKQPIETPMGSVNFLSNCLNILKNSKFTAETLEEMLQPETILNAFQWLVCYLLQQTCEKMEALEAKGLNKFEIKNNTQVFYAKSLSVVFVQHFCLQKMLNLINSSPDKAIKNVLLKINGLYGLWCLEKQIGTLYKGGYAIGPLLDSLIHEGILKLCADLKDDAVSLVDVLAPPDFIINSVLGASDGQVYKRLQSAFYRNPKCMSRPKWWRTALNSKL